MADNQSPEPRCFIELRRHSYEYAFNGTFITNNKHNGSCGGKSTDKRYMGKGFAINPHGTPPFSCIALNTSPHLSLYFVPTGCLPTAPHFFSMLTFLPLLSFPFTFVYFM